jgi:hypothetical protein
MLAEVRAFLQRETSEPFEFIPIKLSVARV